MTYQNFDPPSLSPPRGYSHITVVTGHKQVHVSGQIAFNTAGECPVAPGIADRRRQTPVVFASRFGAAFRSR